MTGPGLQLRWTKAGAPPRLIPEAAMPIGAFLAGRPAEEAAELLPRIFNVCAVTQRVAARLALDLPPLPWDAKALQAEILREHVLVFALRWPVHLGLPQRPDLLQQSGETLRHALFGAAPLPQSLTACLELLRGAEAPGLAVLNGIERTFAPGEASCDALPFAGAGDPFNGAPSENSAAGRHGAHPLLSDIEAIYGRGPFWRAMARALELEALAQGWQPRARQRADGTAEVAAARGTYFCRATCDDQGRVTGFARATPTDHGTAPRGTMHQALASLTDPSRARVDLLFAILDPCAPVTHNPEPAHA
ncbi:MAG: hydrogenase expression/formation protein HupK [Pseudomonadota bacterium]